MLYNFNNFNKINENINNFNNKIDFTYLKDNATIDDIKQLCENAIKNKFYSICIKPEFIRTAQAFLENSNIKICSIIAFPNGDTSSNKNIQNIDEAIKDGTDEIDLVINYKKLKKFSYIKKTDENYEKIYNEILDDIKNATRICHKNGKLIKIIIEIEELNYNQIKLISEICQNASVDFIQSSTGFASTVLTFEEKLEKLKYLRNILPDYINIKISGGIRNIEQIEKVLPFIDRIGTSTII
jgi:deoxyribose-phosphate aldolase